MNLFFRDIGDPQNPPLCLLHGLFGSSGNWMGIVRQLQDDYRLIVPDLRNHGRSPHQEMMDYPSMAEDLLSLFDRLDLPGVALLGHSMGGKTAMWVALTSPERVDKLVVADIAPVRYENRFAAIFQGLMQLPLDRIESREAADRHLSEWVPEPGVRDYLLQNLVKQASGWSWRFNLPILQRAISILSDFPEMHDLTFPGEVLFIHGERSNYVDDAARGVIKRRFPHYRERLLHGAGHWLYAEQPQPFAQALRGFLRQ
ncbi:MAG: alpha/beta fold hydrolase [Candidatus Thiodiazotropha sp.]